MAGVDGDILSDRLWQGTLDIMVQRTGDQGEGNILFVQNNFYYDAFFLKAIGTQFLICTVTC